MNGGEILKQQRREEAYLLTCRLISECNRLLADLAGIAKTSLDIERMRRDPHCVSDDLRTVAPQLMRFDLLRLSELIQKGF